MIKTPDTKRGKEIGIVISLKLYIPEKK